MWYTGYNTDEYVTFRINFFIRRVKFWKIFLSLNNRDNSHDKIRERQLAYPSYIMFLLSSHAASLLFVSIFLLCCLPFTIYIATYFFDDRYLPLKFRDNIIHITIYNQLIIVHSLSHLFLGSRAASLFSCASPISKSFF